MYQMWRPTACVANLLYHVQNTPREKHPETMKTFDETISCPCVFCLNTSIVLLQECHSSFYTRVRGRQKHPHTRDNSCMYHAVNAYFVRAMGTESGTCYSLSDTKTDFRARVRSRRSVKVECFVFICCTSRVGQREPQQRRQRERSGEFAEDAEDTLVRVQMQV